MLLVCVKFSLLCFCEIMTGGAHGVIAMGYYPNRNTIVFIGTETLLDTWMIASILPILELGATASCDFSPSTIIRTSRGIFIPISTP
jgi:hypothetical protein